MATVKATMVLGLMQVASQCVHIVQELPASISRRKQRPTLIAASSRWEAASCMLVLQLDNSEDVNMSRAQITMIRDGCSC